MGSFRAYDKNYHLNRLPPGYITRREPMIIDNLYNSHKGETALIIGNGPSLEAIPDDLLNKYASFGCNRIWERAGFEPDYHVAVDGWVPEENEVEYYTLTSVTLLPEPFKEKYPADYYFRHDYHPMWLMEKDLHPGYLRETGIGWVGVTHAMLQIAFFMGFEKFLCVGLDNTGTGKHFYEREPVHREVDPELWDWGFAVLRDCFIPKLILNISDYTEVEALPRADWRNFV
jgi:hypothetical protein